MKNQSFDPYCQPEEQFKTFFKQSTGFIGAILAGMPVIAGYLDILPPPSGTGKAVSILTMALAATIFLSLFWFRDKLVSMRAMTFSWAAIVAGAVVLIVYLQLPQFKPTDIDPDFGHWRGALKTTAYFVGFVSMLGGFSGVFVCGFVRSRGRSHLLNELLPQLEPHQWEDLRDYARTLITLNGEIKNSAIQPASKQALERSHAHILGDYKRILSQLESGTLEIRGPAMDELYQYFLDGVQKKFSAISRDDLEYWSDSQLSGRYLLANKKLISEKKKTIERLFILNRAKELSKKNVDALCRQIDIGVSVSIAFMDRVEDIAMLSELDFGLFDTFAISSWKFGENKDRIFQIMTAKRDIERHVRLLQKVKEKCEQIPGKDDQDGMERVFQHREEVERWASLAFTHPTAEEDIKPPATRPKASTGNQQKRRQNGA